MSDARPIDANKLKEKLQARRDNGDDDFDKGYNIGLDTAVELIDSAPTVPNEYKRQIGKWIKADNRPKCEKLYCSNCKQPSYTRHCKGGILVYHYCPNCGAKMKGEEE